jgi:hypothetical protein
MNDAKVIRRVRGLIARANHPGTLPTEAAAARAKADKLVLKYGLGDLAQLARESPPAERETTIVHWMSGFTPSGSKSRAWCRCGYRTTPRADEDRALRALVAAHQLDTAECVLCGVTYADWPDFDFFLQVLKDPMTGDEFAICQDPTACSARARTE